MLEFPLMLPFFMFMLDMLEFPPALVFLVLVFEPLVFDDVLVLPPVVVVVLLMVVVELVLVVVFALLVLVFSVVQPVQKTATASKAKRAMVLRIEFSPVTQRVSVLRVARRLILAARLRNNSAKV